MGWLTEKQQKVVFTEVTIIRKPHHRDFLHAQEEIDTGLLKQHSVVLSTTLHHNTTKFWFTLYHYAHQNIVFTIALHLSNRLQELLHTGYTGRRIK